MIRSRSDYLDYLEADRLALGRAGMPPLLLIQDPIWYFQRLLRKKEFYANCRPGLLWWPMRMWLKFQMKRARLLLGFNIPLNAIGPGLMLIHEGGYLDSPKCPDRQSRTDEHRRGDRHRPHGGGRAGDR